MQSATTVDPAVNFHWLSQELVVAVAQSEEPNSYWLLCGHIAGSGRHGSGRCRGWLRRPRGRGGWLTRRKLPARERPL